MKIQTENKRLFSFNALASILTAGLLLFGASSCNNGERKAEEDNAVAVEEYEEEQGFDGLEDNQEVTNLAVRDDIGKWDENGDEKWDENEFGSIASALGLYNEWDGNNNSAYEENELYGGVFNAYDQNEDKVLDKNEFNTWNTAWGGKYGDAWDAWDADRNNVLSDEEYMVGVRESAVFEKWDVDKDGSYTAEEINRGMFETWDNNGDGYLIEEEYNLTGYSLSRGR